MIASLRRASGRGFARRRVAAAVVGALACPLIAGSAAPALASWGIHQPVVEGAQGLSAPIGLAVDQAGDIYVGSLFAHVREFNLAGDRVSPPSPFGGESVSGVALNPVSGNVYVVNATGHEVDAFNPGSGQLEHSFLVPGTANLFGVWTAVEIASDVHGNVYVPDATEGGNKIEVFNETGEAPEGGVAAEIKGAGSHALKGPEGVAIDPAGNVWVADTGDGRIEEFGSDGMFLQEIESPGVRAVAVDDETGDVFASVQGEGIEPKVIEYSSTGLEIAKFGEGLLGTGSLGPNGIAVDPRREILYVAVGSEDLVQRFVSWAVTTGPTSSVTETQATLNGTVEVEPGTSVSSCKFEYGSTNAYGSSVPCSPLGPYATNTPVSATLSGLTPGVDYHYRISATNAGGFTQVGQDKVFGAPGIGSQTAEAIVTTATLRAKLDPHQLPTRCEVQYLEDVEFVRSGWAHAANAPCAAEVGPQGTEVPVEVAIGGLQANTTYDYRFVATNGDGATDGEERTFALFGIKSFAFDAVGQLGEQVTQAGAHPYELTETFRLNTSTNKQGDILATDANPKDIVTELPPGLIGNPNAVPKCAPYNVAHADCPGATQVGTLEVYTANPSVVGRTGELNGETPVAIYNLVPPKGLAAQFGARFNGFVTVRIDARLRTGGDYGVTAEVLNSSTDEGVVAAEATLWGVPAEERHTPERDCPSPGQINEETHCLDTEAPRPFLTNPTACTGTRSAHMSVDSWQEPSAFAGATHEMPAITGCGKLSFAPQLTVAPESTVADSPTGLHVDLHVPQIENPSGLAEADLKDAVVTLPAGVTVNPAGANGLQACSPAQIELNGPEPARCPEAAKIGSVEVNTPLVSHPLDGSVYVAQQGNDGPAQGANPFGSLLAVYIAIDDPETGVVVKLAGEVTANPLTGQLATSFLNNPQLPFEELKLDFFGGPRAALASPQSCGTFTTTSDLVPWSSPATPDATPFSSFEVTGCASPIPFAPSFSAGTVTASAASASPFTLTLSRSDGQQDISGISTTLPPGLVGMISQVPLCDEAQANAGSCPEASKIGTTTVAAGAGLVPLWLTGRVYLTGPYNDAPFGLSVVVPAKTGPFDLGNVVVRAAVNVDPNTSAVTVTSAPLPQIREGIPFRLKTINVTVDRRGFMLNPTSCEAQSVKGTIAAAQGAIVGVSSPFVVGGCASLPFKPSFSASTQAKASKEGGASLDVKVSYPAGAEANIKAVKVALPKQLPSRLTTLQKACVAAVFEADPTKCPRESVVGIAKASTPLLPVTLTGPAYLVSHAAEAFPNLVVVLQGEGVRVDLTGQTAIRKGITTSTFGSIPDIPVSSFELYLPEGRYSILGTDLPRKANYSLCRQKLAMPTSITAQNGAVIKQTTGIKVTGCPKAKRAKRKAKKAGTARKATRAAGVDRRQG